MEEKMKFIAIGLAAALLISIFLTFQSCGSKKTVMLERDTLKSENISLAKKIEEGVKDKKNMEEQFNALKIELDKLTKEKDSIFAQKSELQKQYDALVKDKDALTEKLKTQVVQAQQEKKETVSSAEDAYWAGILKSKSDLTVQLENLRSELNKLRISNEQLQRDKSALELDLGNIIRDKEGIAQQIRSLDGMSVELVREKNTKMKLQDDLSAVKKENSALRRQLKYLNARKAGLETRMQKLQEDKAALQRQFNEMSSLLENKMSQMGDIKNKLETIRSGGELVETAEPRKESVELPPIVVRPQSEVSAPAERISAETQGIAKILEVNRDSRFVIIDLGEDYGLKIGDLFQVYRAGRLIGTVEVVQVRKGITACDIKKENTPIKAGDIIK